MVKLINEKQTADCVLVELPTGGKLFVHKSGVHVSDDTGMKKIVDFLKSIGFKEVKESKKPTGGNK